MPDLARVDPDAPDAANLWRVHWFNSADRKTQIDVPGYVVLPPELTGVKAPIVVLLGCRFPMIGAHKVLAAYACLVPRLVTGSIRPLARPGDLALDRKLLPGRGRDLAHSRMSRRCRSSGRNESRTLRLAAEMGRRSFGHHPHAGYRKQRQGDLRQVRGARARQTERNSQSVFRICQLSHPLSLHRTCVRPRLRLFKVRITKTTVSRRSSRRLDRQARSLPAIDSRKLHGTKIVAVEAAECPTMHLQRLWRAQHPGHRRQAYSAHPQRHEHRRRYRGVGCSERCAEFAVRRASAAALIWRTGAKIDRGSDSAIRPISEFQV